MNEYTNHLKSFQYRMSTGDISDTLTLSLTCQKLLTVWILGAPEIPTILRNWCSAGLLKMENLFNDAHWRAYSSMFSLHARKESRLAPDLQGSTLDFEKHHRAPANEPRAASSLHPHLINAGSGGSYKSQSPLVQPVPSLTQIQALGW